MINKVFFVGAGPGDPELITVKGKNIIEKADYILYTGSLVPEEMLCWAKQDAVIESSAKMTYDEIFAFMAEHVENGIFVRLQTGDPSFYSTIARQIEFLNSKKIDYEIIPGVTAAFGAAATLGIEYSIPGVSQSLILSRIEGNTPNPEPLIHLLKCRHSSLVFYLSVNLLEKLVQAALDEAGYKQDTPCWIIEKASWPEERIIKGTLNDILSKVRSFSIKGTALILLGDFLYQQEKVSSHLYSKTAK